MTLEWGTFLSALTVLLGLDLYLLSQKQVSKRKSIGQLILIVGVALGIFFLLLFRHAKDFALDFFTAYTLELALSMDNVFLFFIIFKSLKIPAADQKRILVWGILSAMVLRVIFIYIGLSLLQSLSWIIYVFGLILMYTGYKMLKESPEQEAETLDSRLSFLKKLLPLARTLETKKFFLREQGKLKVTLAFVALLAVEGTDLIFAIDSIPAVLSITQNLFIIVSSNLLAILGLRALYTLTASALSKVHYLHYSLSIILLFVGVKMLLSGVWHAPTWLSLAVIGGSLAGGVSLSLLKNKR